MEEDEQDSEDEKRLREAVKGKRSKYRQFLERRKEIKNARKAKPKETVEQEPSASAKESAAQATKEDTRFSALFSSSAFAIDKTHPRFKGGVLASEQVHGKAKSSHQSTADDLIESLKRRNRERGKRGGRR